MPVFRAVKVAATDFDVMITSYSSTAVGLFVWSRVVVLPGFAVVAHYQVVYGTWLLC